MLRIMPGAYKKFIDVYQPIIYGYLDPDCKGLRWVPQTLVKMSRKTELECNGKLTSLIKATAWIIVSLA